MAQNVFGAESLNVMRDAVRIVLARCDAAGMIVSKSQCDEVAKVVLQVAARYDDGADAVAIRAWDAMSVRPRDRA